MISTVQPTSLIGLKQPPRTKETLSQAYLNTSGIMPYNIGYDLSKLKLPTKPSIRAMRSSETPADLIIDADMDKEVPIAWEISKIVLRGFVELPAMGAFGLGRDLVRPPALKERHASNGESLIGGFLCTGGIGMVAGRLIETVSSKPLFLWALGAGLAYAAVTATWGFISGIRVGLGEARHYRAEQGCCTAQTSKLS